MKTTFLAGVPVGTGHPVRIMVVINASPESFFKGSVRTNARAIKDAARRMADEGADFIDIGAMSTAPYLKTQISEPEEARRLMVAIEAATAAVKIPVSVDTSRAWPALVGLEAGAKILNDITGLTGDTNMPLVAKKFRGVILMAHPNTSSSRQVFGRDLQLLNKETPAKNHAGATAINVVKNILKSRLRIAVSAGVPKSRIALDPGIGFFRNTGMPWWKWDLTVLRDLPKLQTLGVPLLVGVSRKSFIGEVLKIKNPADRLAGSLAATAIAVKNGAAIIRTHDVKLTKEAVRLAERI